MSWAKLHTFDVLGDVKLMMRASRKGVRTLTTRPHP